MLSEKGQMEKFVDFKNISVEQVKAYWNRRPCNVRHSPIELGTRAYFDEVEARKYFVEPHISRFAEFEKWKRKHVLEIGCGIGTDTIKFARFGARVTAVDVSERSLEIARQRARIFGFDNIKFYCSDAEELTKSVPVEPYDLIYSFGVIHHTPHPERVMNQIREYLHPGSTVKVMIYNRFSWKVLRILLTYGRGRIWQLSELVAKYSEAETGCPVTYIYSKRDAKKLMDPLGLRIKDVWADHIFPYRIPDYTQYRYVKVWYFRWMPRRLFRMLERRFGWHLCITAKA